MATGRGRAGVPPSAMGARPITGAQQGDGAARPMTAVRAAGFTSFGNKGETHIFIIKFPNTIFYNLMFIMVFHTV